MIEAIGCFDLETTGVDPEEDRIVSAYIGIVDGVTGTVIEGTYYLLNPLIPIPEGATAVHGITTDHAREHGVAPAAGVLAIAEELDRVFSLGIPVAIYNAPFDLTLLDREIRRHEVGIVGDIGGVGGLWFDPRPVFDALVLDKAVDKYRPGKRTLEVTAAHYGIPLGDAHNSQSDAVAAALLALKIIEGKDELRGGTADDIHRWSVTWHGRQADSFRAYLQAQGGDWERVRLEWPVLP